MHHPLKLRLLKRFDVIIIGGGQSGLAVGYYLRRTGLSYIILDNQKESGGAWLHTWRSLQLFSPAQWSSLPGMIMDGGGGNTYPARDETLQYLERYESKYNLPVKRAVDVNHVTKDGEAFALDTSDGMYYANAVVSATGSYSNPFIPEFPGRALFKGKFRIDFRKINLLELKVFGILTQHVDDLFVTENSEIHRFGNFSYIIRYVQQTRFIYAAYNVSKNVNFDIELLQAGVPNEEDIKRYW